jgi:hypothetical protein
MDGKYFHTGEDIYTAYERVIKGDLSLDSHRLGLMDCGVYWPLLMEKHLHNEDLEESLFREEMSLIGRICIHRRLFVTDNGWMGIGPAAAQPGDQVCILFGGYTPLVLSRIVGNKADEYNFLGDAYVHGMMDGQILLALQAQSRSEYSVTESAAALKRY